MYNGNQPITIYIVYLPIFPTKNYASYSSYNIKTPKLYEIVSPSSGVTVTLFTSITP